MRVPLMFVTPKLAQKRIKWFRGIARKINKFFPTLSRDLEKAYITQRIDAYTTACVFSSVLLSIWTAIIVGFASYMKGDEIERTIMLVLLVFLGIGFLSFIIFIKYPQVISKKIAADTDRHLMFALKDLLLHTSTGTSLYDAIISVSNAGYGEVSRELHIVGQEIHSGMAEDKALEGWAERTSSVYLKKIIWQMLNSLRSGGNISEALHSIVDDLTQTQRVSIITYANELNLWSLIYMLFAVAAPTIGITMMIILSSFADVGINSTTLILFTGLTVFVQIVIIGLIKSRRPGVEF